MIEDAFDVKISARGEEILIEGGREDINRAERIISDLSDLIFLKGFYLRPNDVDYAIRRMIDDKDVSIKEIFSDTIPLETKKRLIIPKSATQKRYLEAMKKHDIVIAIGPAGTGKTYLAMAMAVTSLMRKEVSRIILARPAVEAGEKLGFLPGTISEKVNPYLRPLYDAMYDMMELEKANRLIERGEIEIAPLAYMRGRTLNDSFVILDEAQNATSEQMKMFLTRLGFSSKSVITGDITQVDLPIERISGLIEIQKILADIPGIEFIYFSDKDVVRHKLVQDIIKAYGRYEGKIGKGKRRETREA
ncbi:MAG: PhoH family protein [Nitrospirae bacterium]|nr:PhoH family protein [Nitrospirota bacterium]